MQLERRKTPGDFSSGKVPGEAWLSCAIYVQKMKIFDCAIQHDCDDIMFNRLQLCCVCCSKGIFIEELPSALQLTRHPPRDQKIPTACRGMCSGTCAGQVWAQLNPDC